MGDFVWLANPETGAPWACPADALDAWRGRGWEPCDEPAPVDPATAERPAPPAPDTPAPPAAKTRKSEKE